ncbi:winged helix-turn-helix transcriptional regulator [Peribacillus frigoritolerans]|uniref:winged helix-turn-helix transcriptional regulator n=1 Tax=Peribacillus frigoritolerans TaxID=450367 RepID=UPI0039A1B28A
MNKSLICPRFIKATNLLSQRWTGLIIYQLFTGSQRFSTIQSAIGVSGKVLSSRLKDLEYQGIIKRDVFSETPVRIEYSLTDKGLSFEPLIKEIEDWSQTWIDE